MPVFFSRAAAFRKWLQKNHKKEKELLVGFFKLGSGKPSITWPESVDQALCFGWIDGVRRSINEVSYCIRFTPRRPSSIWSDINIRKVEELTKAGLMTADGTRAFELRKENKSGIYSHENLPIEFTPEHEKLFRKNRSAWNFFAAQAPSYQKLMKHWVMRAKQEKTRLSRLEKLVNVSGEQKRML